MALTMLRDPLFADFRLMDDLFGRMFGNMNRVTGFIPALDLHETEDEYLALVDLPGVKSEDVVVELNEKAPTCCAFAEPSSGLEPETPSLPWKFRSITRVHARSLATHILLQIAPFEGPEMRRETSRMSFLMCPFCVRGLASN